MLMDRFQCLPMIPFLHKTYKEYVFVTRVFICFLLPLWLLGKKGKHKMKKIFLFF